MANGRFDWLDKLNEVLEKVPDNVDKGLANSIKLGQSTVDTSCLWTSYETSKLIELQRRMTVTALHGMYEKYTEIIALLEPLIKLSVTDLGSVIDAIKLIIKILSGPYYDAVAFVTELAPKLQELTNNLLAIALYTPTIPPGTEINFDKFKLTVFPITMAEVISPPKPWPPIDTVIPKPDIPPLWPPIKQKSDPVEGEIA